VPSLYVIKNFYIPGYLKDIFKEEMPSSVYIRDGKILDNAPEKVLLEKKPNEEYIGSLHYENTPPKNPDGSHRTYDNKKHLLTQKQYVNQAESRKKNSN